MGDTMKIGVFAVLFGDKPFEETLDYLHSLGVQAVEIGTGAYPGDAHCRPSALLGSQRKLKAFREAVASRGMVISALSCHGNPLHPDRKIAQAHHRVFEQTLQLARALDVETVITFSGCPGGGPTEKQPNWIVAPWPPEFSAMLAWQWKERVTPYWKSAARLAREHGRRVAIEMHPNFVVYNPETMARLRAIAPKVIGCNFDPSHMFWQGVDPVAAIRFLGDAVYHVHAKDCRLEPELIARSGVLDAKSYTRELERAWLFRTVGYGNGAPVWKAMVSTLRMVGYDHVISIEHEDSLMSPAEGLAKAVAFLRDLVIQEAPGEAYWA
jgi:sugar phosphate isomerase/epimerase